MSKKLSKTYADKAAELERVAKESRTNPAYAPVYEQLALTYRRLAEQEEKSRRKQEEQKA